MIVPKVSHVIVAVTWLLDLTPLVSAQLLRANANLLLQNGRKIGHGHSTTASSVPAGPTSGIPAEPKDVKTLHFSNDQTVRFKSSVGGPTSVCEMTDGVKTISGYLDVSSEVHLFFLLYEARQKPEQANLDIWLNGGPGSPSMIGAFSENGPCLINSDLKPENNSFSWNNIANMVYIDQPVGTGFSYAQEVIGTNEFPREDSFLLDGNPADGASGRFALDNPNLNTTLQAAEDFYEGIQLLIKALPQLDTKIKPKAISINGESYGGHYVPTFTNYFLSRNQNLQDGNVELNLTYSWLNNPLLNYTAQLPGYLEYATDNPYGIQLVNSSEATALRFNLFSNNGCLAQIEECLSDSAFYSSRPESFQEVELVFWECFAAITTCRGLAEGVAEYDGLERVYDIRKDADDQPPSKNFVSYLNLATVQDALGVDLNFTFGDQDIALRFEQSGDFADPRAQSDLEALVETGVYFVEVVGDADYICNYKGNLAIMNSLQYSKGQQFANTDFSPIIVSGKEVGIVRQLDNLAFAIVYQASHLVAGDQPEAALEIWRRIHETVDIATGTVKISLNGGYSTDHAGGSPVPQVTESPLPQPPFPSPQ